MTAIIGFIDLVMFKVWNFFASPISGVATANSLKDNVSDYAFAKFVRDGDFSILVWVATAILLLIVWTNLTKKAE